MVELWESCNSCLEYGHCSNGYSNEQCVTKTLPSRAQALKLAVSVDNMPAVRYLIEIADTNINESVGYYGETALNVISYYGAETPLDYKVMKYLLDNDANVHAK